MDEQTKKETIDALNAAARAYKLLPDKGHTAQKDSLKSEIWTKISKLNRDWNKIQTLNSRDWADDGIMLIVNVFNETLERYDPSRADYMNYFNFVWARRKQDIYKKIGEHNKLVSIDNEKDLTWKDMGDAREDAESSRMRLTNRYADLTALILDLRKHIGARAANPSRERWYRMFFTEDVTYAAQKTSIHFKHESEVMQAIYQSYLDYYTTQKCHSTAEIRAVTLEPRSKFTNRADDTNEVEVPLPACVSLTYLERCENTKYGNSARSNQRKNYEDMIKKEIT